MGPAPRGGLDLTDGAFSDDITAAADGCVLVFVHVFATTYGPASQHAAGWEGYLDRLDALLAGWHLGEEDAHAAIGELAEGYAAAFDEDPAPARRTVAGMGFRGLRLEEGAATRARAPPPPAGRARLARAERYAEAFGVDPGVGHAAAREHGLA